jgi:hypothetical protein
MATPTRYTRATSFSGYQATSPNRPLPGPSLDNELSNIETSVNEAISALGDIRRDDGQLRNGIVGRDALAPDLATGVSPATLWQAGLVYQEQDTVSYLTAFYRCVISHTSDAVFTTDLGAGRWVLYSEIGTLATDAEAARDAAIAAAASAVPAAAAASASAAAALISQNAAAASATAANNVVTSGTVGAVRHDVVQSLTGGQQTQARTNIGAINQASGDVRYLGETYRNRIINPAMQISQERGTALVDLTTSSVYSVDQWIAGLSVTPGGTLRVQQVASATPGGSPFRLRHTAQAADASIAAGDLYFIQQSIEGQMVADARFGTASARQIVIRFGVRSSLAGTFGVRLTNSAANRSYVTTITIAGGEINTDLVRTIVIPGDTSGTWLTDTGIGFDLRITLAAGTTFQTTAGSWQAGNFYTTSSQTNFMGTASATFELFDVGLYVDALAIGAAPAWELPAWDKDLLACQRYWEKSYDYGTAPAAATYSSVAAGPCQAGGLNGVVIHFSYVEKRILPVYAIYNPSNGAGGQMVDGGAVSSGVTVSTNGTKTASFINSGTALSANSTAYLHWVANARF